MPMYDFRCAQWHVHEQRLSIMSDVRTAVCDDCGGESRRLISAPGVRTTDPARTRLVEAAQSTAEKPAVVSSVPASGRAPAPVSRDPRHAKLPRP